MLNPDTLLHDRYLIIRSIGQGGMGAVYEALDQRLRAKVALKQTTLSGEQWSRAFEHEAQLLAGLRHRALPRVIDHFIEPAGQFLVMEYIPGEDLAGMLKQRDEPFEPARVLDWADQILDALEYLHSQDPPVIHRDIKPQNLKLTPRNELVLLDFGLAKGSIPLATAASEGASLFGYTPQYAPIEQVQGTGTEPRSDLYSLAATLYHLLTGQIPADTLTRASAVLDGKPDPLIPADQVNPAVSRSVAGAIAQGMGMRAGERFANATAMRRALQHASADAPTAPGAATGPTIVARRPATEQLPPMPAPRPEAPQTPMSPATPGPFRSEPAPAQSSPAQPVYSEPAPPPPASQPRAPQRSQPAPARERRGCVLGCVPPFLLGMIAVLVLIIGGIGFLIFGPGAAVLGEMPFTEMATTWAETSGPAATSAAITSGESGSTAVVVTRGDAIPITLDARIQDEINSPGQHNAYTFDVEADSAVFIWTFAFDDGMNGIDLTLLGPDDQEITSRCLGCGDVGRIGLRQGGTYRLVLGSERDGATGSYDIRISSVPEPGVYDVELDVRVAEAGFDPAAALISKPGAENIIRFAVEPRSSIFIWTFAYDDGMNGIDLTLIGPDDQEITSRCLGCGNIGRISLREGGVYQLVFGSQRSPATGTYDVRINSVPTPGDYSVTLPLTIAPGAVPDGADLIARPGATQIFRFDVEAGRQIFVRTLAYDDGLNQLDATILGPDDQEITSRCLGCGDIGLLELRDGGTYRLIIGSQRAPATGTFSMEVTLVTESSAEE
jgi:serine/threonine protein kinase